MRRVNIDPMSNPDLLEGLRRLWNKIWGYPQDPVEERMRKRKKKKHGKKKV